jgi:hypothetical protein
MKIYLISLILIISISCNRTEYKIDYQQINFPEEFMISDSALNALSKNEQFFSESFLSKSAICSTEKESYSFGETIVLFVKNNTKDTVYFFPNEIESKHKHYVYMDPLMNPSKNDFKKELISEKPAIIGVALREATSFTSLHIYAVNQFTAVELGFEVFLQPLAPGKKMTFNVKMPNKPGHYRFFIHKFSHDPNGKDLWGSDRFFVSNSFDILSK